MDVGLWGCGGGGGGRMVVLSRGTVFVRANLVYTKGMPREFGCFSARGYILYQYTVHLLETEGNSVSQLKGMLDDSRTARASDSRYGTAFPVFPGL
jgi:hypothetical protein